MENVVKQHKKHHAIWLKEYEWKPGQSGNPKGRKPGKSLKEWAKEFLMSLPDEKKLAFLREVEPDIVWRMAEGNPATALEGNPDKPLIVQIESEIAEKYGISSSPSKNS